MDRIDQREVARARTSAPKIVEQSQNRKGAGRVDLLEGQITQRESIDGHIAPRGLLVTAQS